MSYFVPKSASDLDRLVAHGVAESANLEFKSVKLLSKNNDRIFSDLSRELTAFANAAGGVLIIGVEEGNNRQAVGVDPITDNKKNDSWIEDGLLPRIAPTLQMDIQQVPYGAGFVLVIDVPVSRSAPHQAADNKFYARRLFRVDPLLPFEIDDIRRRTIANLETASLSMAFSEGIMFLEIRNDGIAPIFDAHVEFQGIDNADIAGSWSPGLTRPYTEPFRILHPGESRSFPVADSLFFEQEIDDELRISLLYSDVSGKNHKIEQIHYLKDFRSTHSRPDPNQRQLVAIVKALENISRELRDLKSKTSKFVDSVTHPSGLNLSLTTLTALTNSGETKWPGYALEVAAISELLNVDHSTAAKIQYEHYAAHHLISGQNLSLEELDVSDDVKEKIRKLLKPSPTVSEED